MMNKDLEKLIAQTGKVVFFVYGFAPAPYGGRSDDFNFIGVFNKEIDASDLVGTLNDRVLEAKGLKLESEDDADAADKVFLAAGYRYVYEELNVLRSKK